jgi:hypothetical protein
MATPSGAPAAVAPYDTSPVKVITHESPPRYKLQGAESDSSDDEGLCEEKVHSLVQELLQRGEKDPSAIDVEAWVKFKNPFNSRKQLQQMVCLDAQKTTNDKDARQITLHFTVPDDSLVYYSFNYDGRYTPIKIRVIDSKTKERQTIEEFFLFQPDFCDDHHMRSLNNRLKALFDVLSESELKRLKSSVVRKLKFDDEQEVESASALTTLQLPTAQLAGALVKLKSLTVKIPY